MWSLVLAGPGSPGDRLLLGRGDLRQVGRWRAGVPSDADQAQPAV